MKKEIKKFEINYNFSWLEDVKIEDIKKDLHELEKIGATHLRIQSRTEYDSSYVEINAIVERIETDDEFNVRVSVENIRQEEIKKRELAQLEKLKVKYKI